MHRIVLSLVFVLASCAAGAQAPRHETALIVPASQAIKIDGDLSEWDLSASLQSVYQQALASRFSARFAFMYDAQAFYIGAHIVDETPLVNRHDPLVEPNIGWAGDALQVRLSSDPALGWPLKATTYDASRGEAKDARSDRIVHLTMWYFTDRSEPVLHLQYGMDYHGTRVLRGAESGVAFKKNADGRGYTIEARIPWRLLNVSGPPKAEALTALTVQPLWGDPAGTKAILSYYDIVAGSGFIYQNATIWGQARFVAKGNVSPSTHLASAQDRLTPLTLTLPVADAKATNVSAAVFDKSGALVRTLPPLQRPAGAAGTTTLQWDGLDDDGQPLAAGAYTVKSLTHHGIGQRYITSLHNAGNPPWNTTDRGGAWGGDHGDPIAAAADASRVYLGWRYTEAGSSVIAISPEIPGGEVATRVHRKYWGARAVLDIGFDVRAIATDGERIFVAQDGKPYGSHNNPNALNIAGVVLWDARTGDAVNFPFGRRIVRVSEWKGTGRNVKGIAVSGDLVFVTLELDKKVVSFNWKTGARAQDYPLPRPRGIATEKNGELIVTSDRDLVRLDPVSGRITTIVKGLVDPHGVAVDQARNVYVSDRGSAMQVKVFTSTGKALRTVGRLGGRPALGRFDPSGMFNPAGLAVDANSRLWVTEEDFSPRRVSVWSPKGELVADYLGAGQYATMSAADPSRPAWVNTHHTLFEVDYETGKSKPLSTLIRPGLLGFQASTDQPRHLDFRHVNGRAYVIHGGRQVQTIFLLDPRTLSAQPVAAMGSAGSAARAGLAVDRFPETERAEARKRLAGAWLWTDRNGDRLVQLEEIETTTSPRWGLYWGSWVDHELTIWSAEPLRGGGVYRVQVKSWLPDGVPVYAPPTEQQPLLKTEAPTVMAVMPSNDGKSVYALELKGGNNQSGGGTWEALSRYDLSGRRLWSYRKIWVGFGLRAPLYQPGYVVGAMKFIGSTKVRDDLEIVGVNGYFGQFNLLSGEGLWVAALGKDNRYGPTWDENLILPESFSGFFFRNKDNGNVYLMGGDTDARIWQVTGLETVRTARTTLTISDADRRLAFEAAARDGGRSTVNRSLHLRRLTPAVDGDLREWDLSDASVLDAGAKRKATVALAYDDAYLYLAADVADDSPLRNSGSDYALLFKTGDSVNLTLAHPSGDANRKQPGPGDLRLLFTTLQGKPAAVLYQALAPAGHKSEPRLFGSPTGAENFERVVVLPRARVAVTRTAAGYRMEAAVPLADLGLAIRQGMLLRGDVGVIFSDVAGTSNVIRKWHFNADTGVINDIPTEARLEPDKWGSIEVR